MAVLSVSSFSLTGNKSGPVPDVRPRDEQRLVVAAKCGDSTAFDKLVQPLAKRTLRIVYRVTRNREDAEDALQDSFLRAFIHIKDFDCRSSFSTWLTSIAINSALTILRKRRNSSEIPSDGSACSEAIGHTLETADRAANPERHYLQKERERILRRAIRVLRPPIRAVVEIQQLQERSVGETARIIGITVAAAKARLFQARAALRKDSGLKTMARTPNSDLRNIKTNDHTTASCDPASQRNYLMQYSQALDPTLEAYVSCIGALCKGAREPTLHKEIALEASETIRVGKHLANPSIGKMAALRSDIQPAEQPLKEHPLPDHSVDRARSLD